MHAKPRSVGIIEIPKKGSNQNGINGNILSVKALGIKAFSSMSIKTPKAIYRIIIVIIYEKNG